MAEISNSKMNNFRDKLLSFHDKTELKKDELDYLYNDSKRRFFNYENYKWSEKECITYISKYKIDPEIFIQFLERVFLRYYEEFESKKGRKGAVSLINNLKKNKQLNSLKLNSEVLIPLKPDYDFKKVANALEEIYEECIPLPKEKWIKMIFHNSNTNLKFSTFRKKYFENRLK